MKNISVNNNNTTYIHLILFFIILFIGIALRAFILWNDLGTTIDSDEAIAGLMGKHILEGREYPIFWYGQDYMGTIESYLAAGIFAVGGVSVFSLKLLMLILTTIFIVITYYLAKNMTDKITALLSVLFLSIGPSFFAIYSLKARGGYIETLIFGSLLLLLAFKIMDSDTTEDARRAYLKFSLVGFIGGIAWWTNQLIIYYFVPVGVILFIDLKQNFSLKKVLIFIFSFVTGNLPALVYKITHIQETVSRISVPISFSNFSISLKNFFLQGIPVIFGSRQAWSDTDIFPFATVLTSGIYGVALLHYMIYKKNYHEQQRKKLDLALLFVFFIPLLFCISKQAGGFAKEPRYLMPIYSVITTFLSVFIINLYKRAKLFSVVIASVVIFINIAGTVKINPELQLPFANGIRVSRDFSPLIEFLESKNIDTVYAHYWIAYRLTFETNENILAIPWGEDSMDRYPKYRELTKKKVKYSIVLQGLPVVDFERFLSDSKIYFEKEVVGNYNIFFNFKWETPSENKDPNALLNSILAFR